ncbi:MAG: excinuclease ABC subunit A [Desulfobacteraceae bacterium 4572_130]|nr:MAG: excinuclease ABC subunit A [Desulfobacteraceae bacterium 4572_130]
MSINKIIIKGAREHNLKNINLEIPKNSLVTITGLSGSGKSSLAFDTLYAEGQRRYVESLSTYARQFLGQMKKPDVDFIEGLSPAISIEQKATSHNPRSTVGTVTEIYDYLRLLFARTGKPYCYKCGLKISSMSIDQITDRVMNLPEKTKIIILSPLIINQKGTHEKTLKTLKKDGFARVRINNEIYEINELPVINKTKKHTIDIVIDRLIIKSGIEKRITDSLELALSLSNGIVTILDFSSNNEFLLSEKSSCVKCGVSYPEFKPTNFSFNSPQGACPACDGLGAITEFDPDLIVPDKELSLRQGAVSVWVGRDSVQFAEFLDALTSFYNESIYTPFKKLAKKFQDVLFRGSGKVKIPFFFQRGEKRIIYKKKFEGIIPNLERRYHETNSSMSREEIKKYMNFVTCSQCKGTRLNKASSFVRVAEKTIGEITSLSVEQCEIFISQISLQGQEKLIAKGIIKELTERLMFLRNVGLDYLTLNRAAATLSGGESQRIRLATQIGSKLTGVLYVLDEPSIGLHQRDNKRLLNTLLNLRDIGNSVLIVEHDEETMLASDYIIDMGPAAGINGGQVIFSGTPNKLLKNCNSLTGEYLSGKKRIEVPEKRRKINNKALVIKGAGANNLKNINVSFPLGCFICVTGVSGSGKSTLVLTTLYRILANQFFNSCLPAGNYVQVKGLNFLDKVIHINQSPIGRTPRSNPVTYTGIFTFIRELFAKTPEARAMGYKIGRFSFNVKGGRCEACSGDGILKIEMHFLPDVYVPCDICNSKRYNRETLDIKYKGKNIAEILDLTVNQAIKFFDKISYVKSKLQTLVDVGLGYIKIGQPATTLSGGEAQRIKLAKELSKKSTGKTIYILDEPTTGLHTDDINKLLSVLNRFVESGNTVVVIEHNLDVIKYADHIIDLGPEGGDKGGKVIGCGTPEEIAELKNSYTGIFLKKILSK